MQDTAGSMTFPMSEVKQKSPSSNVCDNTAAPLPRLGQVDLVNRPDKAH